MTEIPYTLHAYIDFQTTDIVKQLETFKVVNS